MNKYQERLMDKPSIDTAPSCARCGIYVGDRIERHHIVPRSQGGKDGPTVTVCGWGNTSGCHGMLHQHRLHLDWNEPLQCWEYCTTGNLGMKFEKARNALEWNILPRRRHYDE